MCCAGKSHSVPCKPTPGSSYVHVKAASNFRPPKPQTSNFQISKFLNSCRFAIRANSIQSLKIAEIERTILCASLFIARDGGTLLFPVSCSLALCYSQQERLQPQQPQQPQWKGAHRTKCIHTIQRRMGIVTPDCRIRTIPEEALS